VSVENIFFNKLTGIDDTNIFQLTFFSSIKALGSTVFGGL